MATIGRAGGKKSRRQLDTATSKNMVRVREARRAYRRFHTSCFWSFDPTYPITLNDVPWVAEQLKKHGGRACLGSRNSVMPLTPFQQTLARLLAANRSEDSHLAGDAALHLQPNSKRYSNDLDYFHDSVERVATAFADDETRLEEHGYAVVTELNQPGYIRATVQLDGDRTKIEWAHDSAWRFMPAIKQKDVGYQLHPIDLAINKVLALAGRDEARDFLDVLMIDAEILPLGALCWAAAGKDPGFSPLSLLELLKRRGKYQQDDFLRLQLVQPVDLTDLKSQWLNALDSAEHFIAASNPEETGCLYYDTESKQFIAPTPTQRSNAEKAIIPHFGRPGGVLPSFQS